MTADPNAREEDGTVPPPRINPYFAGHDEAERTVLEAHDNARLAHAWLITGPAGIGKATLAYRMARFLLSRPPPRGQGRDMFAAEAAAEEAPVTLDLAPDNPVFRRIAAGSHADFLAIERTLNASGNRLSSSIRVDQMREIGAFLAKTPAEGGWRVVIVDAADDLNPNAANAILKVLEEPPSKALLILVAHNPSRLPPTVRSRCRRLALKPLAEARVIELLGRYCPGLSADDAGELAALADGSIGRATALAADGGLDLYREMITMLGSLPKLDISALHQFGDRLAKPANEDSYRTLTGLLTWWLARLVGTGAGAGSGAAPRRDEAAMKNLLAAGPLDRWVEVWEKLSRLFQQADNANLDRKQIILNAFLTLQSAARR